MTNNNNDDNSKQTVIDVRSASMIETWKFVAETARRRRGLDSNVVRERKIWSQGRLRHARDGQRRYANGHLLVEIRRRAVIGWRTLKIEDLTTNQRSPVAMFIDAKLLLTRGVCVLLYMYMYTAVVVTKKCHPKSKKTTENQSKCCCRGLVEWKPHR